MDNLMDQLAIVPSAQKANIRYKIPPWFRGLFNLGNRLSHLAQGPGNQLFGCLILPESCTSALAVSMGLCTSVRRAHSVKKQVHFKEGDHALVDGQRAVCTGLIERSGQLLTGFRFREESGKRQNSEPISYIPESSLPERVIAVSGTRESGWISTRKRKDSFHISELEAEIFGKDNRQLRSESDSLLLTLSGVVRHFDEAASEIIFTKNSNNANHAANLYDMILPEHATPDVVQPLCKINPRGTEIRNNTPVSIWSDPVSADFLEDSESQINLVIRTASHSNTRDFCSEFLSIYQSMGFDPIPPASVSALSKGIPAAFFGSIREGD